MCIITVWQHTSSEVTLKGFKKYSISTAVERTDDDMLWNGSEEDTNVKSECKEDERMPMIDTNRQNLTCFVYYVHEIVKYFFLADVLF